MKKLSWLLVIACFLVSCGPKEQPVQSAPIETSGSEAEVTAIAPTQTHTIIPSPTDAPTRTPTKTSTTTPSSTVTPSEKPTETPTPTRTPTPLPTDTTVPTQTATTISFNACIPADSSAEVAKVIKIIDGNTVEVSIDGKRYEVRYIGIDTPQKEEPLYDEAVKTNSDLVLNKEVILIKDESETDTNSRLLRYVYAGDVFVNLELVKMGLAAAVEKPPDTACGLPLASMMDEARSTQMGIWQATQTPEPSNPVVVIVGVNKGAEYVDIQNQGSMDVDLGGWILVSEKGNQSCPLSGNLKTGETLRIWAMTTNEPGYSCGFSKNIWNNTEPDPAVLYNAAGVEVSRW